MSLQSKSQAAITLTPALVSDISSLLAVHAAAFRSDLFSVLMLLNRPEGSHQLHMRRSVDEWFADPKAWIIKAVDEEGDILGWTCWTIKEKTTAEVESKKEKIETRREEKESKKKESAPVVEKEQPKQILDPARVLGGLMWADKAQYEEKYLQGKKYMVLQALATAPACQKRGIGTKLVQWGADLADAEGLICWAHASPSGHGLYRSVGFEEMGKSDFDLSEWAPGGKDGGRGWVSGLFDTFRGVIC